MPGSAPVARISDEVRAAVVIDLRKLHGTREGSTRAIATRHGISEASVRRIAFAAGLDATVTQALTKNAIEAARLTNAQRRERLAARLLDMAERALEDMNAPATVFNFGGKDNTYNEREMPRPPTQDQRNLAIIAGVALDKHKMLEQFDSAGAAGQQADLLLRLLTGGQ
jgi:hypothetical protein